MSNSTSFDIISSESQLNNVLQTYTGDLSSCLANCSNQGVCVINSQQQYICQCNQYRTGVSCQSDTRPCSSGPCLNNGTCSNINNDTSFQCTCQNELFYGRHCENLINLCLNSTICTQNQGHCQINGTQPMCKCFKGYSGANCETISASLVITQSIISASTIIAIAVLTCFALMVFVFDYTKFCLMKKKKQIKMLKPKKKI
jgi:hypothetical protein